MIRIARQSPGYAFLIACLVWVLLAKAEPSAFPSKTALGDHYLLLVSAANASTFTPDKVVVFDQSEYQGVAVSFLNPYDASPIPPSAQIEQKINEWKKSTKKDLWPWLFLNRMIGPNPVENNPHAKESYFARTKGADLDGSVGSERDFLSFWANSLRAAKNTQTPGIVVDPEFYLNYAGYDPTKLAKQMGKTPQETVALLRRLGAQLADLAGTEYSNATLWFLLTDLGDPKFAVVDGVEYYPSPAYVVMGLLDEIQSKRYPLTVISGGEVGLGYCHTSMDQLKMKIRNRSVDYGPSVRKYAGILELGGVLALWNESAGKSEWMNDGFCGKSSAATVEDLQPYLELILQTYRYNWIYASGNGSYYPFHPRSAPRFDAMIRKAEANIHPSTGH